MGEIRSADLVAFYLFDVAEAIDLTSIQRLIGGPATAARLSPKPVTPPYLQYEKPPVSFDGAAVGVAEMDGFRVRVRAYDYGVLSLALTCAFSGSWPDLMRVGQSLVENEELEQRAEGMCRSIVERLGPALTSHRDIHLSEDYLVYVVHELDTPQSAADMIATHGGDIAAMLRGERQELSVDERDHILRHRISYLADDLVVPTWNAAFVMDTPAGAQAALEILEFANSQLLEFRYYDERLDNELVSIYADLQRPRWYDQWVGSRHRRAARRVHALFVEVSDVTDRTKNALKLTGDAYAARLFTLTSERLGLGAWKSDVEDKLKTLDDIYRFAVEQAGMSRGQLLEMTIVLILIFELLLVFLGVMT